MSTRSKVSRAEHYQLYNLPFPRFSDMYRADERALAVAAIRRMADGDPEAAVQMVQPFMQEPPFGRSARDLLEAAVERIIQLESERGEIARAERSQLADAALPTQAMIDRLLFTMAGLSHDETIGLEERLSGML